MTTDYKSFTNAELSKQIKEMQAELQKRENVEKEQRWTEIRNILHNWFRDYGEIPIYMNFTGTALDERDDYSTIGEIHIKYRE